MVKNGLGKLSKILLTKRNIFSPFSSNGVSLRGGSCPEKVHFGNWGGTLILDKKKAPQTAEKSLSDMEKGKLAEGVFIV